MIDRKVINMSSSLFRVSQLITEERLRASSIELITGKENIRIEGTELYKKTRDVAVQLKEIGISCGKKVVIQIYNKEKYITAILALFMVEAVPIILPVCMNRNNGKRLENIRAEDKNMIILADDVGQKCINKFAFEIKKSVLYFDGLKKCGKARQKESYPAEENWNGTEALIIFSSGSTSDPKGVIMTHQGIHKMLQETKKRLQINQDDIMLSWLTVEHTFGLIYFLLLPIYVGCKQIHMETALFAENPLSWWDYIHKYRATITAAPNFAYQLLEKNLPATGNWNLACVKYILNGGEPISKKVMETFMERNLKFHLRKGCIIPIYGMTETSGAVVLNCPYSEPYIRMKELSVGIAYDMNSMKILSEDLVCQGTALEGCEIRITDDNNNNLGEKKIGNIQIKGDYLCKGYFKKVSEELFEGNWLRTGDIGFLWERSLFIVGRKKDMFFLHGKNVYMRDIEQIILEKYQVRSAACGEHDAKEDKSKIYLFVELLPEEQNMDVVRNEIFQVVQKETGIRLADVVLGNDLFMTQIGKVSKSKLLEMYKKIPQRRED